jgi:hypothetical protein
MCRHREAEMHSAALMNALIVEAPADAWSQLPHLQKSPVVVWLKHCEPEMVAVNDEDRSQHRAYLESVVAEGMIIEPSRLAPHTADDRHPQGGRLCGQCRGRCCEHGAGWRAFIDLTVLQRWQEAHPASSFEDAIEAYVAMLPAEHVSGACLYQTATGCAMPRERRADICNGFACPALEQVQRLAETDSARPVLAITFHKDRVVRAAIIEPAATYPVTIHTTGRSSS